MKLHEFCLVSWSLTLHTCTKKWVNTSKRYCKLNTRLLSPVFASFSRTRRFWLSQNPIFQCLIPNISNFVAMSHCFLFLHAALWDFPNALGGWEGRVHTSTLIFFHNFGYLGFTAMPSNRLFLLFILLSFGSFRQEGEISINSSSQLIMKFLHNFFNERKI